MKQSPSPAFAGSIRAALAYWQGALAREAVTVLEGDRLNLYRAVAFGLALPDTAPAAAEVATDAFQFVYTCGYWREWLPLMEQARGVCPRLPLDARIRLLTNLAFLRRLNRRLDDALSAHREALALARRSGERLQLAEAHGYLGRALRDARQYAEAEQQLQMALQCVEGTDGHWAERVAAYANNILGMVNHDLGRLAQARRYLERAVALRREHGRAFELSESLHDLGNACRDIGAYEDALACYEEASALLEGTGFRFEQIRIRYSVGVLHFSQKSYALAEATFRALDFPFLRETGNLHWQAMILNSLGNALLYQEQFREAERALRESVGLWRQLDDDLELANAIGSWGEALVGLGETEAATATFSEALALLAQYPANAKAGRLRALFTTELEKVAGQTEA